MEEKWEERERKETWHVNGEEVGGERKRGRKEIEVSEKDMVWWV